MVLQNSIENIVASDKVVPNFLAAWITNKHFLTKKLKKLTGDAHLEHLSSQWDWPDWWEQHFAGLNCERIFRRQILIHSGDFACWYAKTIIPAATFYTYTDIFKRLQTQSLGDILFSEPRIERVFTTTYAVDKRCIEYYWPPDECLPGQDILWLKLSEFRIDGKLEFFLTEIFLPDFETCLQKSGAVTGD